MNQSEIFVEWEKLRVEHENARDAYFKALACLNQKFAAMGQGVSNVNPNDSELSEFDEAWNAWEDIKNRMYQFAKDNA